MARNRFRFAVVYAMRDGNTYEYAVARTLADAMARMSEGQARLGSRGGERVWVVYDYDNEERGDVSGFDPVAYEKGEVEPL